MKLTIKAKLLLYIVTTSIILFAITIGYIEYSSNKMAYEDAKNIATKTAKEYAAKIEKDFNSDLMVTQTLAEAFQVYDNFDNEEWQTLITKIYHYVYESHPNYYAIWDSWELNKIDSTYFKPYGRIISTVWTENGVVKDLRLTKSLDGDPELYGAVKKKARCFMKHVLSMNFTSYSPGAVLIAVNLYAASGEFALVNFVRLQNVSAETK